MVTLLNKTTSDCPSSHASGSDSSSTLDPSKPPVSDDSACSTSSKSQPHNHLEHQNIFLPSNPSQPLRVSSSGSNSNMNTKSLKGSSTHTHARSLPSLTRPHKRATLNSSITTSTSSAKLLRPFSTKTLAARAVSEYSALYPTSPTGSTKFQAVRAANQPTTVILPTYSSANRSLPTTATSTSPEPIHPIQSQNTHSNISGSQKSPSSSIRINMSRNSCIQPLTFSLDDKDKNKAIQDDIHCEKAIADCSIDTDIDNSFSDPSSPISTDNTSLLHKSNTHQKNCSTVAHKDKSDSLSNTPTNPSIPSNIGPAIQSSYASDSTPNISLDVGRQTLQKSLPQPTDQQHNTEPSLEKSSSSAAETKIDLHLSQHQTSQNTPQQSFVKEQPLNASTNGPNSFVSASPPFLSSPKNKPTYLDQNLNSNSPLNITTSRHNPSRNDININTAVSTKSPPCKTQSKALQTNKDSQNNSNTMSATSCAVTIPTNTFSKSETNCALNDDSENKPKSITISKNKSFGNAPIDDGSDTPVDSPGNTRMDFKKPGVCFKDTHSKKTGAVNKERKAGSPRGIIKNTNYNHFDSRGLVSRYKTVRFDSALLESRIFIEDNSDNDPDYADQDEEIIEKQNNLIAQFERDFGSDSDSDDESTRPINEEKPNQDSVALSVELDPNVNDTDPTLILNTNGTILDDGNDIETLDHNSINLSDSDSASDNDENPLDAFALPGFGINQKADSDSDSDSDDFDAEIDTDNAHCLDFGNCDYDEDDEDDLAYDPDFNDDYDEEEEEYLCRERLDYPDGDVAHSNKLLNRKIPEDSLPPLQSHHQIRAAIQKNHFKNVIALKFAEIQTQMDNQTESEENPVNSTIPSEGRQSLFKPCTVYPKNFHESQISEKMLESYCKSMANSFFKWVAETQQSEEKWADAVKTMKARKVQNEQGEASNAELEGKEALASLNVDKHGVTETGVERSKCHDLEQEAITKGDSQGQQKEWCDVDLKQQNSKVADTNVVNDSSNETKDVPKSFESGPKNPTDSPKHDTAADEFEKQDLPDLNDSVIADPNIEIEELAIDPFTLNTATDILHQDLTLLFENDCTSVPWLTKAIFLRILYSFQRTVKPFESQLQYLGSHHSGFTSLQNEIVQHEEQDADSVYPVAYNTNMSFNPHVQHPLHFYAKSNENSPNQFGMTSSNFSVYNNITSVPTILPPIPAFVSGHANGRNQAFGYENPMVVPPTDPVSKFQSLPSIRPPMQFAGRKRLRSADNLYYQHQINKDMPNNGVDHNMGHSVLYSSAAVCEKPEGEYLDVRQAATYDQTISAPLQPLYTSPQSSQELGDEDDAAPKPLNLFKKRCLRPLNIMKRKFITKTNLDMDPHCSEASADGQGFAQNAAPALPNLSFGPLATSSLVEVLESDKASSSQEAEESADSANAQSGEPNCSNDATDSGDLNLGCEKACLVSSPRFPQDNESIHDTGSVACSSSTSSELLQTSL